MRKVPGLALGAGGVLLLVVDFSWVIFEKVRKDYTLVSMVISALLLALGLPYV